MPAVPMGVQPARLIVDQHRIPIRELAEKLNLTQGHVFRALLGYCYPKPELIKGLCEMFDKTPEELFTADALGRRWTRSRVQS